MVRLGRDRYRAETLRLRSEGRETNTRPGRQLLRGALKQMYQAVCDWQELASTGKPGPWHKTAALMKGIDPGLVALMTCRVVLDEIREPRITMTVATHVGREIEREAQLVRVREEEPWLAELIRKRWQWGRRCDEGDDLLNIAQERGWQREPWDIKEARAVGHACIELLIAHTGLVEKVKLDRRTRLVASQEALDWMAKADGYFEVKRPVRLPTPTPPIPWPGLHGGGYADNALLRSPLIRNRKVQHVERAEIEDMLSAINRLQAVPWKINKKVLHTIISLRERDLEIGGVLAPADEELPPYQKYVDQERKHELAKIRQAIHRRNASNRSKRLRLHRLLFGVGLINDDTVYMPHSADFRGRLFAEPSPSAQGTDIERGLLQFAAPKPIGEDGMRWMAIHGANMWGHGFEREPFDIRQQWVAMHEDMICASAKDPLDHRWWSEADEPIQFLAFCHEWESVVQRGPKHESALCCFADGVNNAFQVYAMLLRDPHLAQMTCCTTDPDRHDIYTLIADRVLDDLTASRIETDQAWVGVLGEDGVPRELVKVPVMAMAFGATDYGQMQFVIEWFEQAEMKHPWGKRYFMPCKRLGEVVVRIMRDELLLVVSAQQFLRKAARRVVRRDVPLVWRAPNGLIVDGTYHKHKTVRVDGAFQSIRLQFREDGEREKIDRVRSSRSMAAHFIHSCDAAALHRAVSHISIDSVAAVHDCLGVRAADMETAGQGVRQAYADTFSGNLLVGLRDQLQELVPDAELPYPPGQGRYDPQEVLDAPYFWS